MSAEIVSHDAGSRTCPPAQLGHAHPVVRLLMVVSGQLELLVGDRQIHVGMGSGVFVGGETPYSSIAYARVSYVTADFCGDTAGLRSVLPEPLTPLGAPMLFAAVSAYVAHVFTSADTALAAPASLTGQRATVLDYIAAHHTDTELNVATLAARFGLSTRSLQRLFEGEDKGVAEELAAARLGHALTLLWNPLLGGVTLDEIAARSGFGSVARMRRAIRNATGKSPREHRVHHGDVTEPSAGTVGFEPCVNGHLEPTLR